MRILDAGSGNGMLSYQAWRKGAQVIGISFKEKEIRGCRELFNRYLAIPEKELCFTKGNLYDLDFHEEFFDEIICSEVLEHLERDTEVCRSFWWLLKPGGVLHLCAPNAEHPYNASFPLDPNETGGHVRAGYTLEDYRKLLEPIGFEIVAATGLGGPIRQAFNRRIKEVQERFGVAAGLPLFLVSLPFLVFESGQREKKMPFSIYIKALKHPGVQ
ncbi:MAG: class I SAM-dependent methyltransferase [Gammaproteobacteria bacterium]|nr:class I SAM-dependent methyltransferase [Gammaproteobacteria bacterium]